MVLVDGHATAWIARGDRQVLIAVPEDEPERTRRLRALARELVRLAHLPSAQRRGWLLAEVNGEPATASPYARDFIEAGFSATGGGLQLRVLRTAVSGTAVNRTAARAGNEADDA